MIEKTTGKLVPPHVFGGIRYSVLLDHVQKSAKLEGRNASVHLFFVSIILHDLRFSDRSKLIDCHSLGRHFYNKQDIIFDSLSESSDLSSMDWEALVTLKRKVASELKETTDKIVDIDRNQLHAIAGNIKSHKSEYDSAVEKLKRARSEIDNLNGSLLQVSEKMSKSKNFLSIMEARLPKESEDELQDIVSKNQILIDEKMFKGEREKGEILSRIKDASMKIEAIKATRTIREQYTALTEESAKIGDSIKSLNDECSSLRAKITQQNSELDKLYDNKRGLMAEREKLLSTYGGIAKHFEAINARLDEMSSMRKRQREEYGYNLPSDALFKIKETARKKLESGSKLSFDELKLLYNEKE